ncbi:MAG: hypothetical protein PVG41_02895 [Desulfobacteraceae bacterium]|jgi:hypothetical protein
MRDDLNKKSKFIIACTICILFCFSCGGPRWPRSDVKVINKTGWWPYQNEMQIESFNVEVVEAPLNLFNNEALIAIKITGSIKNDKKWMPYIDMVQISENFIPDDRSLTKEYTVVPVVAVENDDDYLGENILFNTKIEYIIKTNQWGQNIVYFKCRDIRKEIVLHQRK